MVDAPNHYDSLKSEVESYIDYSRVWMRVWAFVYYGLRTGLIVLSACVAAKDSLTLLIRPAPLLSLLVAVGTSLDTWLKTGNRYRGHYTFNDKFIALHTDVELTDPADASAMAKIQEQFKKLVDDYALAVLPT